MHNKNYSHFLSQITFSWISPLLWFGYCTKRLQISNLGALSESDSCRAQYDLFQLNYKGCSKSLWKCYFRTQRKFIILGGFLKLISDCLILIGPLSIRYVMDYLTVSGTLRNGPSAVIANQSEVKQSSNSTLNFVQWEDYSSNGYFWAFGIFISLCTQSVMSQCSTHLINMVGIWIRNSLQGLIYRKALSISLWNREADQDDAVDVGKFTNLMVDDSYNVMSFFWIIHLIWAIPLKIILVLGLMYLELGWSSVMGAVLMMCCLVPFQFIIGKCMSANMDKISVSGWKIPEIRD